MVYSVRPTIYNCIIHMPPSCPSTQLRLCFSRHYLEFSWTTLILDFDIQIDEPDEARHGQAWPPSFFYIILSNIISDMAYMNIGLY